MILTVLVAGSESAASIAALSVHRAWLSAQRPSPGFTSWASSVVSTLNVYGDAVLADVAEPAASAPDMPNRKVDPSRSKITPIRAKNPIEKRICDPLQIADPTGSTYQRCRYATQNCETVTGPRMCAQ